ARPTVGNPTRIHLSGGTYGPEATGERDLHARSFVSLVGVDSATTILDFRGFLIRANAFVQCVGDTAVEIAGIGMLGAGILFDRSNSRVHDCSLRDSGGITCDHSAAEIFGNRVVNSTTGVHCLASNARIERNTFVGGFIGVLVESASPL